MKKPLNLTSVGEKELLCVGCWNSTASSPRSGDGCGFAFCQWGQNVVEKRRTRSGASIDTVTRGKCMPTIQQLIRKPREEDEDQGDEG